MSGKHPACPDGSLGSRDSKRPLSCALVCKKSFDAGEHVPRILSPALPDSEHSPTRIAESAAIPLIPFACSETLVSPESRIRGRLDRAIRAAMNVPEASVNKDHLFVSRNDYVGLPWEVGPTDLVLGP